MNMPQRAQQLGLVGCHACGLVCEVPDSFSESADTACPRCYARLQRRKPASMERTLAFLVAAIILYIPANLLPVMLTRKVGYISDSTIMAGVLEFWQRGSWGIALIIFIASIVVPCTKFLVLGLLLVTVRWKNDWARRDRSRLYRLVEFIGYWSMLDVLVVGLMSGLVQFKALSNVEPRVGIFFFGIVVVLAMLSALSFDPRLIWDDERDHERKH